MFAVTVLDHRELETARSIVALQKPAYAIEAALIGYDQIPGLIESPADVAALDLTMLGAFEDAELVGVLGYQRIGDVVDVDRVAVSTAHFRKGIGHRLLAALHERETTALRFKVSTGSANPAALALYTRAGYRPVQEEPLAGINIIHLEHAPKYVGSFTFQRLERDHFPLLARWLAEPHVARWWHHEFTLEAIERDFGGTVDGRDPSQDYIVTFDSQPIGLIQYCHIHDFPEYVEEMTGIYPVEPGTASIDYLIGAPDRIGAGLGTAMISSFVERVWATDPTAHRLVVPVNSANVGSWRALLHAGFSLATRGEMDPDNPAEGRMHEVLEMQRPTATSARGTR